MDIIITAENTKDYLLVTSKGTLRSQEDLFKEAQLVYEEVLKYDAKKILVNQLETTLPLSLFNYYNLVNHYISNFPPDIRSLKAASVIAPQYEAIANFWETVCNNRGYLYKAFTSLKDAQHWLIQQ